MMVDWCEERIYVRRYKNTKKNRKKKVDLVILSYTGGSSALIKFFKKGVLNLERRFWIEADDGSYDVEKYTKEHGMTRIK